MIHATTREVLLDFVARDKHHHAITDLHPEEVQVYEDGVLQKVNSFRNIEGAETCSWSGKRRRLRLPRRIPQQPQTPARACPWRLFEHPETDQFRFRGICPDRSPRPRFRPPGGARISEKRHPAEHLRNRLHHESQFATGPGLYRRQGRAGKVGGCGFKRRLWYGRSGNRRLDRERRQCGSASETRTLRRRRSRALRRNNDHPIRIPRLGLRPIPLGT